MALLLRLSVAGGLRTFMPIKGNLKDIDINGLSLLHIDKDHNTEATDYPFKYGHLIHGQYVGSDGNTYKLMIGSDGGNKLYVTHLWGRNANITWKTITFD